MHVPLFISQSLSLSAITQSILLSQTPTFFYQLLKKYGGSAIFLQAIFQYFGYECQGKYQLQVKEFFEQLTQSFYDGLHGIASIIL